MYKIICWKDMHFGGQPLRDALWIPPSSLPVFVYSPPLEFGLDLVICLWCKEVVGYPFWDQVWKPVASLGGPGSSGPDDGAAPRRCGEACTAGNLGQEAAGDWSPQPDSLYELNPASNPWVNLDVNAAPAPPEMTAAAANTLTVALRSGQLEDPQQLWDHRCCCFKHLNFGVFCYAAIDTDTQNY